MHIAFLNPQGNFTPTGLDSAMEVIEQGRLRGQASMFALRGQGRLAARCRFFVRRHSVYALTVLYEPSGLASLEVMAACLPAVVTKVTASKLSVTGELHRVVADSGGIFVQPALYEGFELTMIEAMACGLPVVRRRSAGSVAQPWTI